MSERALIPVLGAMDPRLQRLVALRQRGLRKRPTSSTGQDEVAVVAKVTDLAAWEALGEVRVGAALGGPDPGRATLVTARIPVARIEHVRRQPFVGSLKPAQRLRLALHKTTEEIGARADLLPSGHLADGARGVVVGIVDFGCDFVHQNFRNADGTTRLLAIWDQGGPSSPTSPFGYGRLYSRAEVNAALKTPDPYAALGYGPDPDSPFLPPGTHGTHVTDIAAGNGRGSGTPGVAPKADLVFVEVASTDIPWTGPEVVGQSFGDSVQLLEAVSFIFDQAGERPCVVNLSLGTNGGPHDGTMLVEEGLDRLVRAAPGRAVVIAASNSYADGIHAAGTVPAGGRLDLRWQVPQSDFTHNELEVWYPGAARLTLELMAPDGTSLGTVPPGENGVIVQDGQVLVFAANRLQDPNNGDNMIGVFLERGLPAGDWLVRLQGDLNRAAAFHAWIERDDASPSQFPSPHDNSHTIGSISCGHETFVVGSYDAHKASVPLSYFSSAGPTRDGREKPEVSAPGHDVWAAHSRTGSGVVRKSGTSMAAPAVTGTIALMLAEARARNVTLATDQIRELVLQQARKLPPPAGGWDTRYGDGRVSACDAVAAVIALAPAPPGPTAAARRKKRAGRTGRAKASRKAGRPARRRTG